MSEGQQNKGFHDQIILRNCNQQRLVQKTTQPGTDCNARVWVLLCERESAEHAGVCGHQYGANGTDAHERKCPKCQDGKDGFEIPTLDKCRDRDA